MDSQRGARKCFHSIDRDKDRRAGSLQVVRQKSPLRIVNADFSCSGERIDAIGFVDIVTQIIGGTRFDIRSVKSARNAN